MKMLPTVCCLCQAVCWVIPLTEGVGEQGFYYQLLGSQMKSILEQEIQGYYAEFEQNDQTDLYLLPQGVMPTMWLWSTVEERGAVKNGTGLH